MTKQYQNLVDLVHLEGGFIPFQLPDKPQAHPGFVSQALLCQSCFFAFAFHKCT